MNNALRCPQRSHGTEYVGAGPGMTRRGQCAILPARQDTGGSSMKQPNRIKAAMRRQTAQAGALRQEVAPEGAVLRQVLAGDPHPGAFIFHVRQSGVLRPLATTRCTKLRNPDSRPGGFPSVSGPPSGRSWSKLERSLWLIHRWPATKRWCRIATLSTTRLWSTVSTECTEPCSGPLHPPARGRALLQYCWEVESSWWGMG